ncbi:MAG: hypothetical protein KDN22_05575 [Verrucomicrobiae bacterium]|nr:hypothetical protein [Verrucomicrobiae bacterium]
MKSYLVFSLLVTFAVTANANDCPSFVTLLDRSPVCQANIVLKRNAKFTPCGQLDLSCGAAVISAQASRKVAEQSKCSNEFTMDVIFTTGSDLKQKGPARIVTSSTGTGARNFSLAQDGEYLDFRLRTARTGGNGLHKRSRIAGLKLEPDHTYHVVVSYRSGMLATYVNGALVQKTWKLSGRLSNWIADAPIIAGDEMDGGRNWNGSLQYLAIAPKCVSHGEGCAVSGAEPDQLDACEIDPRALDSLREQAESLRAKLSQLEKEFSELGFGG